MSYNESINQLRQLLEGKTISKIEPADGIEAICKFVMKDGIAFRLHATDLGFWIENTSYDGFYNSLNSLINDYYQYTQVNYINNSEPDLKVHKEILNISASDNKVFKIALSNLSNQELKIINSETGLKILKEYIPLGDIWKIGFKESNPECPKELYFEENYDDKY